MILSVRTKIKLLVDPTIPYFVCNNLKKLQESTTFKQDVILCATLQIRNAVFK